MTDYSDIETLYGKPSVSIEDVHEAMIDTEAKLGNLCDMIWQKTYPDISGLSKEYIKEHPVEKDREEVADLEARLWQMCHQLIHDSLVEINTKEDEDTYSHTMTTYNKMTVKFCTSATQGIVWFEYDNEVVDDDDENEVALETLFELAQDIYWESKKSKRSESLEF